MLLDSSIQASKGEQQPIVLSSYKTYQPHHWLAWQDMCNGAIVAHTMEVTTDYLIGLKTHSLGARGVVSTTNQVLVVGETVGTRRESIISTFLNKYSFWLPSKCLPVCTQISVVLTSHLRSFFMRQRLTIGQNADHKWLWCPGPIGTSAMQLPYPWLGSISEDRAERL